MRNMKLKYHGLNILDENNVHFRFGIENLISRCQSYTWRSRAELPEDIKNSLSRFHKKAYWQCAKKTRETLFKFDKAVTYLGKCKSDFERVDEIAYDGASMEKAAPFFQASGDIPYHLDSLITYLRILADCIAFAIPFFYVTDQMISSRSFRDHRKWFITKKPKFDPEYREILASNTEWFDKLAGKEPKGIRDVLFHNLGTYQYGYKVLKDGKKELFVQLINSQGIVDENITYTIEEVLSGFFSFLDKIYTLFGSRLTKEFSPYLKDDLDGYSVFYKVNEFENIMDQYALYPLISE